MSEIDNTGIGIHIFGEDTPTKDVVQSVVTTALIEAGFSNVTGVNGHGEPNHLPSSASALDSMRSRFPSQFSMPITVMSSLPDDERYASDDPRIVMNSRSAMKDVVDKLIPAIRDGETATAARLDHIVTENRRVGFESGVSATKSQNVDAYNRGVREGFEAGRFAGYCTGVQSLADDIGKLTETIFEEVGDVIADAVSDLSTRYEAVIELEESRLENMPITKAEVDAARESVSFSPSNAIKKAYPYSTELNELNKQLKQAGVPFGDVVYAEFHDDTPLGPRPKALELGDLLMNFARALPNQEAREQIEKLTGNSLKPLLDAGDKALKGISEMIARNEIDPPSNMEEVRRRLQAVATA